MFIIPVTNNHKSRSGKYSILQVGITAKITAMAINFENHAQKGQEFVNEVALELGAPRDKDRATRILRAVLHGLRNNITPQESLQLIAQLPWFIKALYIEGWRWNSDLKTRTLEQFIESVRQEDGKVGDVDFGDDKSALLAIEAVFRVLKKHVGAGEIEDIRQTLPKALKTLML